MRAFIRPDQLFIGIVGAETGILVEAAHIVAEVIVKTGSGTEFAHSVAIDEVAPVEIPVHDVLFRDAGAVCAEEFYGIVHQARGMRVDLQAQSVFFTGTLRLR